MNSSFVNNLAERNEIFQKIVDTLKENPYIKELTVGQLEQITGAPAERLEQVLVAMQRKAGLGRYIVGRTRAGARKGPNRFLFNYKPEDIVNASLDAGHEADPVPKNKIGRPKSAVKTQLNDAGKAVNITDTRQRHISVTIAENDIEIHISRGTKVDFESLKNLIQQLQ